MHRCIFLFISCKEHVFVLTTTDSIPRDGEFNLDHCVSCDAEQQWPCDPWNSSTAMVRDIFVNVSGHEAVRDFLVKDSPVLDVGVLTSPSCVSKGISRTASYAEMRHDSSIADLGVFLLLPTHSIDELEAGVCVESYTPAARIVARCAAGSECQRRLAPEKAMRDNFRCASLREKSKTRILTREHVANKLKEA